MNGSCWVGIDLELTGGNWSEGNFLVGKWFGGDYLRRQLEECHKSLVAMLMGGIYQG